MVILHGLGAGKSTGDALGQIALGGEGFAYFRKA